MPTVNLLLNPKSIAIVGASNNTKKVGGIVTKNILSGLKGNIYPINSGEETVQGQKNYKNILDLPETPDLIIFAIPAEKVLEMLPQVGERGIKNLLIFSAGFKEAGEQGKILEQKLLDLTDKYQFNILGPNCLGFTNNQINLNATFAKTPAKRGNLNLISQSGAIATSFFDWCNTNSLGFDFFITIGNKSVLNENHFLEFLNQIDVFQEDGLSKQKPIGLYLESVSQGSELIKIAKQISLKQPIFILKPGKSDAAASTMQSHTGSLAGSDEVFNSALAEAGVIRADSMQDFFDLSMALSWENEPETNKIAIISNAGGPAVISADAVSDSLLELAPLSQATQEALASNLPRMAGLHNPIDVLGDALADRFNIALETVLIEEQVSALIVILTPQLMTEIEKTAQIISTLSKKYQKPIYCSFVGGEETNKGEQILNQTKIPNFTYPEEAIKTMSLVYSWQLWRQKQNSGESEIVNNGQLPTEINALLSQNTQGKLLDQNSANQIFGYLGLPTPKNVTTTNPVDAEEYINQVGWPIVLKTADPNQIHKSDSGGVITNINSFVELRQNWLKLSPNQNLPLQIQKQLKIDYELIAGFKRDNSFGDYIVFGLGGKLVNLIKDANICLFPLSKPKILNLIDQSQYSKLFFGYRDYPKLDTNKLADNLLVLGKIFSQFPKIKEMEINPIIVNSEGYYFSDIKINL